ncbi:MAG: HAD family hydrolase [Candidatus Syntrophonatronum acetioxidans]|uniref:HAD family hydrolase n=1 Tax=Candidatus Syntrophonatronum acetioxidans TaxID=1795816 RepID=A0A424YES8_9FIRM|nr:MAG: HAD family hydrolase [Candidatus Syntrophonatronum acetioxidans]
MIKKIVFDFDGTLADTREVFLKALGHLSQKHGFKRLSPQEIQEMLKLPIRQRCKVMEIPLHKIPLLFHESLRLLKTMEMASPYPGIQEVVRALQEREVDLVILSSNSSEYIEKFLQVHDLDSFQSIISTSGLFGKHRDLKKLLKRSRLSPQNLIYVGDEIRDIESSRRALVSIVCVTWGFDSLYLLEKGSPDYLVHEPREIVNLVDRLNYKA